MNAPLNCPCGSCPTITRHEETPEQYEYIEAVCEGCFGLRVYGQYESDVRRKWDKAVKDCGRDV